MKEIAKAYLAQCPDNITPWTQNETTRSLVRFVYEGGIWDGDFRDKMPEIIKKNILSLTLDDIYTYLTAIVCGERTDEGLLDARIADGTLEKLLRRFLEVTE